MTLKAARVKWFMSDYDHSYYPVVNDHSGTDVKFLLRCNISPTGMHQRRSESHQIQKLLHKW